jgi:hypothetical protein
MAASIGAAFAFLHAIGNLQQDGHVQIVEDVRASRGFDMLSTLTRPCQLAPRAPSVLRRGLEFLLQGLQPRRPAPKASARLL